MRALVKTTAGPGMELLERPRPICGPSDVLIDVKFAGVCGTDLHIWEWDAWASARLKPPVIIGHEFAGIVAEIGEEAAATSGLAIGDAVTAEGHLVSPHSLQTRIGQAHLCPATRIIGVDRDGAFAECISMPAQNVVPLHDIPLEIGAIMDPIGNAFHTVLTAPIAGANVLVIGCGPIGCFAVGIAKAAGAVRVIASDFNPRRRAIAAAMGADHVLDPAAEDVVARVREITYGDGADVVCEMSGHPAGHAQAFAAARAGGRVHMLGTPTQSTSVDFARDVIFKGLTIYGVTGRRMFEDWVQMARYLGTGRFDPRPVVTHRFPLDRIADAIRVIKEGEAGKVILEIGQ